MKGMGSPGDRARNGSSPYPLTDEPGYTPSLLSSIPLLGGPHFPDSPCVGCIVGVQADRTHATEEEEKKIGVQVEGWTDGTAQCEELSTAWVEPIHFRLAIYLKRNQEDSENTYISGLCCG